MPIVTIRKRIESTKYDISLGRITINLEDGQQFSFWKTEVNEDWIMPDRTPVPSALTPGRWLKIDVYDHVP